MNRLWSLLFQSLNTSMTRKSLAFSPMLGGPASRTIFRCTLLHTLALTRYSIDCPPTPVPVLERTVRKHVQTLDQYLAHKPMGRPTQQVWDELQLDSSRRNVVVLDSGCGTGRSTQLLADMYHHNNNNNNNNCTVLGVDRSLVRLTKNPHYSYCQSPQNNSCNFQLIRANLEDFWRLLVVHNVTVMDHYLLYPNPYPKPSRLSSRWYAHASFPLLLQSFSRKLVVRSNWKLYLEELATSVLVVDQVLSERGGSTNNNYARSLCASARRGPVQRDTPPTTTTTTTTTTAWTNFEEKYQAAGEATYELVLERESDRGFRK